MNNILVAINNQKIFENLLKEKNINIINKNILYKEGILEILEKKIEINYIIINEKIPGEIEINNLINKIKEINKNINIILIIEKNKKDYINNKNNFIILEEENTKEILDKILNKKTEENLDKNIDNKLKELEKDIDDKSEENIEKGLNRNIDKEENEYKKIKKPIIIMDGNHGSGKSIISTVISYQISKMNKKVLLIDCDIEKGNIHTILQVKKEQDKIQKIYNNFEFINTNKKEIIESSVIKNYDIIIFDNCNYNFEFSKIYIKIFLLESNLIEIEKLKNNINIKNSFEENNYFIINKYNNDSIDEKIIENIFENKNIFKIKYNKKYNSLINNFKINKDDIYLKNEYKNIIKKLI